MLQLKKDPLGCSYTVRVMTDIERWLSQFSKSLIGGTHIGARASQVIKNVLSLCHSILNVDNICCEQCGSCVPLHRVPHPPAQRPRLVVDVYRESKRHAEQVVFLKGDFWDFLKVLPSILLHLPPRSSSVSVDFGNEP